MADLKSVEQIMELFEKYQLTELSVKDEDFSVRIRKKELGDRVPAPRSSSAERVIEVPDPVAQTIPEQRSGLKELKSPIHGNFYRSPSPGAKPYVEVGQNISEGQVVCIVESMKLMNEVKAPFSGKVADIIVEDGKPVGKDEVILLVE